MYQLGIISDEVSADFEQACKLISKWGLPYVELRTMWGKNILELSSSELDEVEASLKRHNLKVSAIASPALKSPRDGKAKKVEGDFTLDGDESFEGQLELIRRSADLAKRFGTEYIRIFTFWREHLSDALAEDVAAKLAQAAELAKDLGVVLAVENEAVCVAGTGRELAAVFERLEAKTSPDVFAHIGTLWDPGNAYACGEDEPFPKDYKTLKPDGIVHIHLKDAVKDSSTKLGVRYVPLGEGVIDYAEQFRQLKADGYEGLLVLEPHYAPGGTPQEDAAHAAVVAAQKVLAEAFEN